MNKKHIVMVALVAAVGVTVFDMTLSRHGSVFARSKKKKSRRKAQKKGKVSNARKNAMEQVTLNPAGRVSTLKAGGSYTIGYILSEIRRNSPKSHFILAAKDKGRTVIKGDPVSAIDGSISADRAGLASMVEENSNLTVTLNADSALVNKLNKQKRLNNATKNVYAQILLYFDLNGYRFYINDPYPAKIVVGRVNPAAQIISRW